MQCVFFCPAEFHHSTTEYLFLTVSGAFAGKLQSIFVPIPAIRLTSTFKSPKKSELLYYV